MDQENKKFSKYRLWCSKPSETSKESDANLIVGDTPSVLPVLARAISTTSNEVEVESQTCFLSFFDLVTLETGERIKKKSLERKKRSCASPHFLSLILQAEKQDLDGNDPPAVKPRKKKNDESVPNKKKKEKVSKSSSPTVSSSPLQPIPSHQKIVTLQSSGFEDGIDDYHEELCHTCGNVGELLLCDTCSLVFHLECAQLNEIPSGKWFCKICEEKIRDVHLPKFTTETVKQQYEDFQNQRNIQLKEAFILRSEKADLLRKITEMNTIVESKLELEKRYAAKIESNQLLLSSIDVFLSELM